MTGGAPDFGHGAGALKKMAERVQQAKEEFARHSQTLDGQIGEMRGKWDGAGGRAFTALHVAWTEKHKTVNDALDGFYNSLVQTEADNVASDEQVGGGFAQLSNRLGPQ